MVLNVKALNGMRTVHSKAAFDFFWYLLVHYIVKVAFLRPTFENVTRMGPLSIDSVIHHHRCWTSEHKPLVNFDCGGHCICLWFSRIRLLSASNERSQCQHWRRKWQTTNRIVWSLHMNVWTCNTNKAHIENRFEYYFWAFNCL